jgi:hypothetical protein
MHEPPQLPSAHKFWHTALAIHFPWSSHSYGIRLSGPFPHFVLPGWHSPVQSPLPVQAFGHGSPGIQAPVGSQVAGR